jgi:hypothetical protein
MQTGKLQGERNMGIRKIAAIAITLTLGHTAFARQNFTLQLNDKATSGNATIAIKQLLQRQHNINPANFQLVGVRLTAKSQHGQATAQLQVGNWSSNAKRIQGNPTDWNRPNKYDQIDFNNNSGDDNGVWQIDLRGNVKTRKVVVVLERNGNGGGGGGIHYKEVRCESNSNQPKQCAVNGRVVSVRLLRQHSIFPCIANQSFGALERAVWVRNGCRGTFEVGLRN